jgi:hypothetical protein
VDDLADLTGDLIGRVEQLEADPSDTADAPSDTAGATEVLAERVQRLEGWAGASGSGLMVNERTLAEIGTRLGYDWRWPVTVRFHEPDEARSRRYGWLQDEGDGYVIHVYTGLGINRAARCICHEFAHLAQVARIGTDYMKVYAECADELEAEADTLADGVADVEVVRAA